MDTTSLDGRSPSQRSDIATTTDGRSRFRKRIFAGVIAVIPIAIGGAIGTLTRSKRAGALAGGIAVGAFALARWQLQRFFIDVPAYKVERRVGDLELRAYEPYVIVRTVIEETDFEAAKQTAFERLDRYLEPNHIKMIAPYEVSRERGGHAMAFIMPPGRTVSSLPRPDDSRVRVMEVPARRIAVLPYRGRFNSEAVRKRERDLLELVADAGMQASGRPMFAGFDPPDTLPFIRRNEIWIEIA